VSPWVSVFSLPGIVENGLREQTHEAAEGVGDAAFGNSPEGHGLGVCKNVVLKVELRLEEFILHVSLPFSFLLFGECLFCIG
jgi:hypothetical protein